MLSRAHPRPLAPRARRSLVLAAFAVALLAPATGRRSRTEGGARLTDAEAGLLRDNAHALLDSDHPSEAISLLEDGIERAGHDPDVQASVGQVRTVRGRRPVGHVPAVAGEVEP